MYTLDAAVMLISISVHIMLKLFDIDERFDFTFIYKIPNKKTFGFFLVMHELQRFSRKDNFFVTHNYAELTTFEQCHDFIQE